MDQKKVEQVDEIKGKSPDLQENQSYPVEVKSHEQSQNSIEEDIDSTIKISVRIGFIRKVYGILSFQLLLTFGSVMLSQLKQVKYYINHNQLFFIHAYDKCSDFSHVFINYFFGIIFHFFFNLGLLQRDFPSCSI